MEAPEPAPTPGKSSKAGKGKQTTQISTATGTAASSALPAVTTGRRRLEFSDGNSKKFWEIELSGSQVTTTWGRIGSTGQSKTKDYGTSSKAQSEYEKLVSEKTNKGYVES